MSIQSEITRIEGARNNIITALQEKGSDIQTGAKIDTIAPFVSDLNTSGGNLVLKAFNVATNDNPSQLVCDIGEPFDFTKKNWIIIGRLFSSSTVGITLYVSNSATFNLTNVKGIGSIKQSSGSNQQGTFIVKPTGTTIYTINGDEVEGTIPAESYRYFGVYNAFGSVNILANTVFYLYVLE